jgi:hypothetical protein
MLNLDLNKTFTKIFLLLNLDLKRSRYLVYINSGRL